MIRTIYSKHTCKCLVRVAVQRTVCCQLRLATQQLTTLLDHDPLPLSVPQHASALSRRVELVAQHFLQHAGQLARMRGEVDDRGRGDFEVLGV